MTRFYGNFPADVTVVELITYLDERIERINERIDDMEETIDEMVFIGDDDGAEYEALCDKCDRYYSRLHKYVSLCENIAGYANACRDEF